MNLSIVTINYNSSLQTIALLESIIKYTSNLKYEIIVVDNNSRAEEFDVLSKNIQKQDNIKLVRSKINLGFGAGNMFGFQHASKSDYLAFINNDVLLQEDTMQILFDYISSNQIIGVCGASVIHANKKDDIKPFSHFYDLWLNVFGINLSEKIFNKPRKNQIYTNPIKVDFVMGSLLFFRATDFAEIGGFDPNIFLYYEEMDICHRLQKINKETYFVPNTTYIHDSGYSAARNTIGIDRLKEQQLSYHHVFRKAYGTKKYTLLYFIVLIKHSFKSILNPKIYVPLLLLHLQFNSMHNSLKYKQKINS